MVDPPGAGRSLEDRDQLGNGVRGQDRRRQGWCGREIGAGDWDVAELTRQEFNLAMADVARQ
jgi:hypothetical protein